MLQEQSMGPGLYGKNNRKVCLLPDDLRFLETPLNFPKRQRGGSEYEPRGVWAKARLV
jgi:hypothetical protein